MNPIFAHAAEKTDFAALAPGFADPVFDAQACFRATLHAMAHPGNIVRLPMSPASPLPVPLNAAAAAVALTLCDLDTPIWLDAAARRAAAYFGFHCGAPLTEVPAEARYALIAEPMLLPALTAFALGSDEYPEASATLVIQVPGLTNAPGVTLRGPGIRDEAQLGVAGLPTRFWAERAALAELFPRGIDMVFASGNAIAALPRSTLVAFSGDEDVRRG